MHFGEHEVLGVRQQAGKAHHARTLAAIIRFLMQLALGFVKQRLDVQGAGQQPGDAEQRGDVVHIALDAAPHAGILDLDRQMAAILALSEMHLADRRRGRRGEGKALKMAIPSRAPVGIEYRDDLAHRHRDRIGTQP